MKKIFCLLLISWALNNAAQNVSINGSGTAPRNCAMLDITSTNTGLLIPTVVLTNVTVFAPLTGTAVDGLVIYSSSSPTGGNGAGYYYWSVASSKWIKLVASNNNAWETVGNSGTTASSSPIGTAANNNFIGTIDNNHFVIATNNLERVRVTNAGNVGIGNIAPSEKLDVTGNVRFSGDLRPNNLPGTTGQVLVSQGTGVAPQWKSPSSILKTYSVFATRTRIPAAGSGTGFTDVTGLSQTVVLTGPATLIITTYGSLEIISGINGASGAEIQILQNGVLVPNAYQTHDWSDPAGVTGTINHWSFQTTVSLSAGSYTFKVQAHKYIDSSQFDNFYAGGNTTAPLASQNQGAMIIQQFDQ
jgi:hypothetical protein